MLPSTSTMFSHSGGSSHSPANSYPEAGLKPKPSKCHFARCEVEYLGHLLAPEGLRTNEKLVEAITLFTSPKDINGVRRFLGIYRRFISGFARIAASLRKLTRKNTVFQWTEACDEAMKILKDKLTTAPVLAYPSFTSHSGDRRLH